jgi:hypothetical protein
LLRITTSILLAGLVLSPVAGCELITTFDRSKIPTGEDGGDASTEDATTESGAEAGTEAAVEAGVDSSAMDSSTMVDGGPEAGPTDAGDGGTIDKCEGGATACTMVSQCTTTTACVVPSCTGGCCSFMNAAKGTACTDSGGVVCDGNGSCVSMHCTDGVKDADETDVDCGGASCGACEDTKGCKVGGDCVNKVCTGAVDGGAEGVCAAPTCSDGVQNGDETDKDCGGKAYAEPSGIDAGPFTACPACAFGKGCQAGTDCVTQTCTSNKCAVVALGGTCTTSAECNDGASEACLPDNSNPSQSVCCATSCTAAAMATCGADGNCKHDGSGCADWPNSTQCAAPFCTDGANSSTATAAADCTGSGTCGMPSAVSCGNYKCGGTVCKTTCSSDNDCASGNYCSGTACVAKGATGATCSAADQCTSAECGPSGTAGTHCCAPATTCSATVAACGATDCTNTGTCFYPGNAVAPAALQTPGDCQKIVCNGSGGVTSVDDPTDIPGPSGSACLINPSCQGPSPLTPHYDPAPTGTACNSGSDPAAHVCGNTSNSNIAGTCVECNDDGDCLALNDAGTLACTTSTGTCQ